MDNLSFSVDLTFWMFSRDGIKICFVVVILRYRSIFNSAPFHVYKILLFRWHVLVPVFDIDLFNSEEMKLNVKMLVLGLIFNIF